MRRTEAPWKTIIGPQKPGAGTPRSSPARRMSLADQCIEGRNQDVSGKIHKIEHMEEFARVSGISRPTVSKYFNDPGSVRQSTRERIEAALDQYDFRPHMFAMNQNRRLTKNVDIVAPYLADPFFAELARRIERILIATGYWPTLFSAQGQQDLENNILDGLRLIKPAGVLLSRLGRASTGAPSKPFAGMCPPFCLTAISKARAAHCGSRGTMTTRSRDSPAHR